MFHINLDPTHNFGQQATQCAAVGTINIGGLNDANYLLYPELTSIDGNVIDRKFGEMLTDYNYIYNYVEQAYNNVNTYYSFESVKQQFLTIIQKLQI